MASSGFWPEGERVEGRAIGHNGGAPGQSGDLLIYPEAEVAAVVLSNMGPQEALEASNFIANRLQP
jgi:hypothetical protein